MDFFVQFFFIIICLWTDILAFYDSEKLFLKPCIFNMYMYVATCMNELLVENSLRWGIALPNCIRHKGAYHTCSLYHIQLSYG